MSALLKQFTDQPGYTFLLVCLIVIFLVAILYPKWQKPNTDKRIYYRTLPAEILLLEEARHPDKNTEYLTYLLIEDLDGEQIITCNNPLLYNYAKAQDLHLQDIVSATFKVIHHNWTLIKVNDCNLASPEKTIKNIQNRKGELNLI